MVPIHGSWRLSASLLIRDAGPDAGRCRGPAGFMDPWAAMY